MVVDVWMQHPTLRWLEHDVFASVRSFDQIALDFPS